MVAVPPEAVHISLDSYCRLVVATLYTQCELLEVVSVLPIHPGNASGLMLIPFILTRGMS